jgi:hypothetical protein
MAAALAASPVLGATPQPVTNVRLKCPMQRGWVSREVAEAAESLARPECGRLLSELRDGNGRPLRENLDSTGLDARAYMLNHIFFYDGEQRGLCQRSSIAAITEPGSRVVQLCPQFHRLRGRSDHVRALLIHETLHTLGLGENPPSSAAITDEVLKHCRPPR